MNNNLASALRTIRGNASPVPKRGQIAAARDAIAQAAAQTQHQAAVGNTVARIQANKQELQRYLRHERRAQGLTQRQLASRCGMSQGTITRAERKGWVSLSCLMRIAEGLGQKVIIG